MSGPEWRRSVFDFYTLDGATALGAKLSDWDGGRLVVHIAEMPIKCPVAPLEFAFLADSFFEKRGMRDRVEMTYVTPLDGAFTKPVAARLLGGMLEERSIDLESDFYVESIDNEKKALVSYDEREIPFDLLVTVPVNMGAEFIARSGLGNELNCVPVDHGTFQSAAWDNIFALGDAADVPTSKAGSVAHFAIELFTENFIQHINGEEMTHLFDGHANCFVESGDGKAMLIDFNYDTQPLPGKYPLPGVGPLSLMQETALNHYAKLMFKWIYWNVLLPGRHAAGARPDVDGRQEGGRGMSSNEGITANTRREVRPMSLATIADQEVHVDDEGFLTEYDEWNERLAQQLAGNIGIDLEDRHMEAIRFLREDFESAGRDSDPAEGDHA